MNQTTHSESLSQLAIALIGLQAEMEFAPKSTSNTFFKSKYADLTEVWTLCKPLLNKHRIAVFQSMDVIDASYDIKSLDKNDRVTGEYKGSKQNVLITTICHESGEWMKSVALINAIKPDPQANGSAITYMRRYQLCALLGVIQDDDDGERAMNRKMEQKSKDDTPITASQYVELSGLLSKCQVDFTAKFNKRVSERIWKSLDMMPQSLYHTTKESFLKNIEETNKVFDEPTLEAVI